MIEFKSKVIIYFKNIDQYVGVNIRRKNPFPSMFAESGGKNFLSYEK